jgi:hypothetical protein
VIKKESEKEKGRKRKGGSQQTVQAKAQAGSRHGLELDVV